MNKMRLTLKSSLLIFLSLSIIITITWGLVRTGKQQTNFDSYPILPTVDNHQNLVKILNNIDDSNHRQFRLFGGEMAIDGAESNNSTKSQTTADYSQTNVQVQGVDEADIIKTDGQYIYQVNQRQIVIARAYPVKNMELVNTIKFTDEAFYPTEIYLADKFLVVIGGSYRDIPFSENNKTNSRDINQGASSSGSQGSGHSEDRGEVMPSQSPEEFESEELPKSYDDYDEEEKLQDIITQDSSFKQDYRVQDTVQVMIYNIEEPKNAELIRDFEVEGSYISSRMIGLHLYLLSNKYVYYYADEMDENNILPWYRDSRKNEDFKAVPYSDIRYFPDANDNNYLMIASLNLDKINNDMNISAYLGSGQIVYASVDNLYIAVPKWEYENMSEEVPQVEPDVNENGTSEVIEDSMDSSRDADRPAQSDASETVQGGAPDNPVSSGMTDVPVAQDDVATILPSDVIDIMPIMPSYKVDTEIYSFSLKDGKASFLAKGAVPGALLNQFSMDENKGYFRVATTTGQVWGSDENTSKNNVYILDKNLKITGKLEGIAPGERIYSVGFMGDRGYMVTFKNTDPLFVIDLKNSANPKVLGQLKIPGYSDYLHPYDENHIMGFGMDTEEIDIKDENGNIVGETFKQNGMKMAMFDVSNVKKPVEKFKTSIGGSGTYSELNHNHKALLFSKEKNILAFPVTIMETNDAPSSREWDVPYYAKTSFQGMHVYGVDIDKGFTLKAEITHYDKQYNDISSEKGYDYNNMIQRALYINDSFYTLSNAFIKAHSLGSFNEEASLKIS